MEEEEETKEYGFYPANPKQLKFMESAKRFLLLSGAVGAGKSLLICWKGFILNCLYPGNRGLLCRKEFTSLKSSTIVTLLEKVIPEEMIVSYDKVEGVLVHKTPVPGINSTIVFSGLDKKADQTYPTKIGSTEYGWIGVDEITELSENDFQVLSSRLRYMIPLYKFRKVKSQGYYPKFLTYEMFCDQMVRQMFGATNPDSPNHYLYKFFFKSEEQDDRELFLTTPYENPYLDKEYIKALENTLTGLRRERLLFGKWVQAEGVIYDSLTQENYIDINLVNDLFKYKYFFGGADSNFPLPRAGLILGVAKDNEIHILDEFYQEGAHPEDLGQWYSDFAMRYKIQVNVYHDPSDPEAIVKINAYPGVNCEKAMNSIIPGIDCVHRLFSKNILKINNSCVDTKEYLNKYKWKSGGKNQPEKKDDHLCFVKNTKIMTNKGNINIQDLKIGDKVLTRRGFRKITHTHNRLADVCDVYILNNKKIRCTPDHPFYVKGKGWVRADALRYSYILVSYFKYLWKELYLMEKAIKKQKKMVIGEEGEDSTIYTEMFMNQYMEKFPKVIKYIIKMVTKIIIQLQIWNVYPVKNIVNFILLKINKKIMNNLKELENLQKSGIKVIKVENGIVFTQKKYGRIRNYMKKIAQYVIKNMKLHFQQEQNIVTTIVKPKRYAQEIVYNITVEGEHEYFANGILVSNCDSLRYAVYTYENQLGGAVSQIPVYESI